METAWARHERDMDAAWTLRGRFGCYMRARCRRYMDAARTLLLWALWTRRGRDGRHERYYHCNYDWCCYDYGCNYGYNYDYEHHYEYDYYYY